MIHKDFADVLIKLKAGQEAEALLALKKYVQEFGIADAPAQKLLGLLLQQRAEWKGALTAYAAALKMLPHDLPLVVNIANVKLAMGDVQAALDDLTGALEKEPENRPANGLKIECLRQLGKFDAALVLARRRVKKDPCAQSWHDLAKAYHALDDFVEAELAFKNALEISPQDWRLIGNYAWLLADCRRLDESLKLYAEALEAAQRDDATLAAERAALRRDFGMTQLLAGEDRRGWKNYAARLETPAGQILPPALSKHIPLWQGEPISGRRLLVYYEQGHGDSLQFCRYIPALIAKGAFITLCVQPALERLLKAAGWPVDFLSPLAAPFQDADFRVPLMSLPLWLDAADLENVCEDYLRAFLPQEKALSKRIGVVWSGSRTHLNDRRRSIPFDLFASIFARADLEFLSLQLESPDAVPPANFIKSATPFADFYDVGAAMLRCELLVSVDTAALHLAGALGVPAFALLPYAPDWRWGLWPETCKLYKTMRLFRQERPGDWSGVLTNVQKALSQL